MIMQQIVRGATRFLFLSITLFFTVLLSILLGIPALVLPIVVGVRAIVRRRNRRP